METVIRIAIQKSGRVSLDYIKHNKKIGKKFKKRTGKNKKSATKLPN